MFTSWSTLCWKLSLTAFAVCITAPMAVFAQSDAMTAYIDGAIAHVRTRSLYRSKPNWESVKTEMYKRAKDAKTVEELAPALKYLLSQVEDSHGKFLYKGEVIAYYFGEPTENQKKIDMKFWPRVQGREFPFRSAMLRDKIGYLRIAGLPMGDNIKMATEIRNAICELDRQKAKSWIVDLRYNGGGNIYPMMEGLAPIIGDATIGYVSDHDGKVLSTWKIKDADFYYDDYLAADLPTSCSFNKPPKVAVLISQYTASSGEAVGVAFKGRPNTRVFGLETAGLITVTDWTAINTDLTASISIGYYTDRNRRIFRDFVDPDERIEFAMVEDPEKDDAVIKAVKWLKK